MLNVAVLQPICDGDVPKLRYEITVPGSTATTVTITWLNPSGANVVYANQPLSGTVNWPGAVEVERPRRRLAGVDPAVERHVGGGRRVRLGAPDGAGAVPGEP